MNKVFVFIALIATAALLAYAVLSSEPQVPIKAPRPDREVAPADAVLPRATQPAIERRAPSAAASSVAIAADDIGSEGYGPHIQRIADEGNARQALKAVEWISDCLSNEETVEAQYQIRGQMPRQAQAAMTGFIEHLQLEARRCQTVTPDITALQQPLALRALQGKVQGAAVTYAQLTQGSPPPEYLALMTSQLEIDARAGSLAALRMLVQHGEQFGLSADASATYYAAYQSVDAAPAPYVGFGGFLQEQIEPPKHPGTSDAPTAKAIADKVLGEGERIARQIKGP